MKKKLLVILFFLFVFIGCKSRNPKSESSQIDFEISQKINSFTEKMFHSVYSSGKNMSFSGTSVYNLLYLMSKTSAGETSEQITKALNLDDADYDLQMARLLPSIENNSNSVWINKNLSVKNSFADLGKKLESKIFLVNFFYSKAAAKRINHFIKKSTKNEIPQFLQEALSPDTKLVFLNTLYFNQKWQSPFPKENTADDYFYLSSGKTCKVKMMHTTERYAYYDSEDFQIIRFEYKNPVYSMIVMLPKEKNFDFSKFELNQLLVDFERKSALTGVYVSFPKFESHEKISLNDTLVGFGITDAFSLSADFSNIINNAENIYVNEILHETKVSVDEEKTKAVAVSLSMVKSAAVEQGAEVDFLADHPFCYVIKDNKSDLILFSGVINNPGE